MATCFCFASAYAGDYEDAWKAVEKHDLKQAEKLFESAIKSGNKKEEALLSLCYIYQYAVQADMATETFTKYSNIATSPEPAIFALWDKESVLGGYGRKEGLQLKNLEWLLEEAKVNGSIKNAATYYNSIHVLRKADYDDYDEYNEKVDGIKEWQFVGPFDNLQNSGMAEEFGPLEKPDGNAVFETQYNAEIKWFKPKYVQNDGWVTPGYYIPGNSDLIYAQSFVNSPDAQEAILCLGFSGTAKVYLNDVLLFEESKTVITEMDAYKFKVQLKSGYNRVVVKLGYNNVSYPNFMVRFTDDNYRPLPGLSAKSSPQKYAKATGEMPDEIPHFSYTYFEDKIEKSPKDVVNYLLLSDALFRNYQTDEAGKILNKAAEMYPENPFVREGLMTLYQKTSNDTEEGKQRQWFLENQKKSYFSMMYELGEEFEQEKFEEAEVSLNEIKDNYGSSMYTDLVEVQLLFSNKKVMEGVAQVDKLFKKYPHDSQILSIKHNLDKEMNNDPKAAARLLEKYLDNHFEYNVVRTLGREYDAMGKNKETIKLYEEYSEIFPFDTDMYSDLANMAFERKDYAAALAYLDEVTAVAPYSFSNFSQIALIHENKGDEKKAIEYYERALEYNPFQYDTREQLRKLTKKPDISDYLDFTDPEDAEEKFGLSDVSEDYSFYYLLDEVTQVIYANGPSETYFQYMIQVLKKDGLETWQRFSLPNGGGRLTILESDLWKEDGSKGELETYGGEIVATDLEVGDKIYVKYKTRSFVRGRSSKYFSQKYAFSSFVPNGRCAYRLIIDENTDYQHKMVNGDIKPTFDAFEGFKVASWEAIKPKVIEEEKYMPTFSDISTFLHISSGNDWKDIVDWYQDISAQQAKMDYSLEEALEEIFPEGYSNLSEDERAKKIYYHLLDRTTYSSIPFRQSGIVPQKAADAYSTGLADCKDISTLFATLAREVGLDVDLVLINTGDSGYKDVVLPSLDFNHCIVKVNSGTEPHYLELTDRYLPYGSLYANHQNASILEIPFKNKISAASLKAMDVKAKKADCIYRNQKMTIVGRDMNIEVETVKTGASAARSRSHYDGLSNKEQKDALERAVGSEVENAITIESIDFDNLEELGDSLEYTYKYKLDKAVVKIGSMQTFEIKLSDVLANNRIIDTNEKRVHPVAYQFYERVDLYEENLEVNIPAGKQFVELPQTTSLSFGGSKYTISFDKVSANKLMINRKFVSDRKIIETGETAKFMEYMQQIQELENSILAYR